jgi:predicted GNAT family acetyltransferase
LNTRYFENAADFLKHAGSYLAKDEARYGLIPGIAKRLIDNPYWYGKEDPRFCVVEESGAIHAVMMQTPPFKPILAYFSSEIDVIAEQLVNAISKKWGTISGVIGDKELTDRFKDLWCKKFNVNVTGIMAMRIYRLDKVNNVPLSPGHMRGATLADKDLVVKWGHAFHIDTGGVARNQPETDITPGLARGAIFIWEDGQPVSMAVKSRATENGMSVGGVYTPPELRGKGYATSCVVELSRNILHGGYQFCTLYTDLSNPASNSIYKKIGYYEVADSVEYTFTPI